MTQLGGVILALVALLANRPDDHLRISGKVTFLHRRLPKGRKVRALLSREFPGWSLPPDAADGVFDRPVDAAGRFSFDRVKPGNWWLCAYIDDDGDNRLTPGREITGYSTINPVPIGDGRSSFTTTVDLDPTQVTMITRFEPATGPAPARRVVELLRVTPLDPQTGAFLDDAEVTVNLQKVDLAADGKSFLYQPDPPEEARPRYVIEVAHPALGRRVAKHVVMPRTFGAVPDARLEGNRVEWTSPPWSNFAQVVATQVSGKPVYDRVARSPLELTELQPGASVRVRIGRVDVQHGGDVTIAAGDVVLRVPWKTPTPAPTSAPTGESPAATPKPPAAPRGGD